jgi:FkbM family methyltransferase
MSINRLRCIVQKAGFDFHRYKKAADPLVYLKTLGINTVVDIGANVGQFAKEIRTLLPDADIHSFEPLVDCYEALKQNMAGDAHFTAYPVALGETREESAINRSSYSLSSSLRPMADEHKRLFPHTAGQTIERVRVERLDDMLAGKTLRPEVLLKIDAQGYEDKVLAGGPRVLGQAKVAILEASFVELYEGQPLFADVYDIMRKEGFDYRGALHQKIDSTTGKILFEDALFIRE